MNHTRAGKQNTKVDAVQVDLPAPEATNEGAVYGKNILVIPATNTIKELQTIIRDK